MKTLSEAHSSKVSPIERRLRGDYLFLNKKIGGYIRDKTAFSW